MGNIVSCPLLDSSFFLLLLPSIPGVGGCGFQPSGTGRIYHRDQDAPGPLDAERHSVMSCREDRPYLCVSLKRGQEHNAGRRRGEVLALDTSRLYLSPKEVW